MRRALLSLGVAAAATFTLTPPATAACEGPSLDCVLYCGPHVDTSDLKHVTVYWVAC